MQDIILTAGHYVTSATNDMVLYKLLKPLSDISKDMDILLSFKTEFRAEYT